MGDKPASFSPASLLDALTGTPPACSSAGSPHGPTARRFAPGDVDICPQNNEANAKRLAGAGRATGCGYRRPPQGQPVARAAAVVPRLRREALSRLSHHLPPAPPQVPTLEPLAAQPVACRRTHGPVSRTARSASWRPS
jgi:hypothetical protein